MAVPGSTAYRTNLRKLTFVNCLWSGYTQYRLVPRSLIYFSDTHTEDTIVRGQVIDAEVKHIIIGKIAHFFLLNKPTFRAFYRAYRHS